MKQLTVVIPPAKSASALKKSLDSFCGKDQRIEALVFYRTDEMESLTTAKEYQDRFPDIVRALETEAVDETSVLAFGVQEAEGRYFKLLQAGDLLPEKTITAVLDKIENSEADIILTGYQVYNPDKGSYQSYTPKLSCSGRQIDMIKLSEKYAEIRKYLGYPSLCYKTQFLAETCPKTEEIEILPFIFAESMMIVPDLFYVCTTEHTADNMGLLRGDAYPDTVQHIVSYYESCKPMGQARSSFLKRRISQAVLESYAVLFLKTKVRKEGREKAEAFRRWLMEKEPSIAKITERRYRFLRRAGKYKDLFHCKTIPIMVKSTHV